MAIKGKKKPRSRAPARSVAPRPKIEARRPPLARRTWFRRSFVAATALLALFVVLAVLGRTHRASALRDYDRRLATAQRPFQSATEAGNAKGMSAVPAGFAAGSVPPGAVRDAAKTWEDGFRTAAENVRGLTVPEQLRTANEQIALAMDEYVAVARIYAVAADERDLQNQATDAALKKKIGDHITTLLAHITDMKSRADALLAGARAQIDSLKREWGVEVRAPAPTTQPSLPGGVPS